MSKQIRFVFHRAKFDLINVLRRKRKIHLIDDVISLWTGLFNWFTPGLSHWEGWIPDDYLHFTEFPTHSVGYYVGTCYTSTMRGKNNGTVSRPASEVFTHPERWYYLEFEVTDESFEIAKAWADERVAGKHKYSMKDIRRFFMPLWLLRKFKWDDPDREICSEHGEGWATRLVVAMRKYGMNTLTYMLSSILIRSPRRLWRDLVRIHHVPTYSLATGKMVYNEKGKKVK